MGAMYDDLWAVEFSKQGKRCAVMMFLVTTSCNTSNMGIADMLRMDMMTIQRLRKRLEDKKHPRAVIQRVPKTLEDCRKSREVNFASLEEEKVHTNPGTSIRTLPRELNVDKKTVWRCIKADLHCKSYRHFRLSS